MRGPDNVRGTCRLSFIRKVIQLNRRQSGPPQAEIVLYRNFVYFEKGEEMMKITLKDGSVKEYENQMAVIDIAKDISEGLARMACAGEIDGETVDLRTIVCQDCRLDILTAKEEN